MSVVHNGVSGDGWLARRQETLKGIFLNKFSLVQGLAPVFEPQNPHLSARIASQAWTY